MEVSSTYFCPSLVLEAFVGAASQDPSILKKAEIHLKSWETQPGFYSAVASIFLDTNIDANVRWVAAMYFKNGIDRYWRKNAPSGISEEEKTYLKQHLLESFNEPILQIASQVAILIGKIARHDCPRFWPSLVPVLIQSLQSTDSNQPIKIQRATLTFYQVVKAMVSKKLPADRKVFEELTNSTFELIFNKWKQSFDELFISLEARQQANLSFLLSYCVLLTKIMKKLLVYGFSEIRDVQMCRLFLIQAIQKLDSMLQSKLVFERFLINMMNLMKDVLKCEKYKVYRTSNEDQQKNRLSLMVQNVKINFFTIEMLRQLVEMLLLQYFLLKNDELHCWDSDPESFTFFSIEFFSVLIVSEESGDSWKFSWRPCVESLFLTLTKEFKDIVCPIIMQLVNQYLLSDSSQHQQSNDIIGLLKIDAVYNAVGLCTYHLYDFIDFDQWFNNRLVHELALGDGNDGGSAGNSSRNYRIIKRRVIWLIGKWVGVKMSYLEVHFKLLFDLLKSVSECETKLSVLHVMTLIIERMEADIHPHIHSLIHYLPLLWDASEHHNLLRCAIITNLSMIVQGLGSESVNMHQFLLPVIKTSTDVQQAQHVYLCEDALHLWLHAGGSSSGAVASVQCPPLTTSHVIMTSRLLIHSSQSFLQLVSHLSGGGRPESMALVDRLVEGLLNKFDCLYQADKKKICVLALLSLLQSQYNRSVLSKINRVLSTVVDTLHDVCKEDLNGRFVDTLLIVDEKTLSSVRCDEDNDYDISTDIMEGKHHQIIKKDPIHSVCLLSHVRSLLDLLQMHCPNFNEEIELEILQQLKHFLCK
ncbi:hypothetical protein HELRODRAFT_190889 [Helobdella robusta]|uniref:Importin N-terminal domain-containing protein n=1 Tax=Helobdella robusta TaxID=6412 RepID=T1FSE2_HELRO|nr:hypothetical protein HELRODRAFT_190889 [Helobdella robusta]ESO08101.1 hypothetical protein HELRODRAFT_190889 [Helobdella robusta]